MKAGFELSIRIRLGATSGKFHAYSLYSLAISRLKTYLDNKSNFIPVPCKSPNLAADKDGGKSMRKQGSLLVVPITEADLTGANLTSTNLTNADLAGANLTRTNFYLSNLAGANLTGANLTRTNFHYTNLIGADLTGANLTDANLDSANLNFATLSGANLAGADLKNASMHGVRSGGIIGTPAHLILAIRSSAATSPGPVPT